MEHTQILLGPDQPQLYNYRSKIEVISGNEIGSVYRMNHFALLRLLQLLS